jgi:thiosulfate reductase/polysulfide reductase chain A
MTYVPEMQIFYATNRPMSTSDTDVQFRSFEKTFNVTIEVHMSETAWMSDIVLPDQAFLESWHFAPTRWTPRTTHKAIRQPVVNAYGIPHDAASILWELSKRLGIRDDYIKHINKNWKLKKQPLEAGRDYSPRELVEAIWVNSTGKPFDVALNDGFVAKKVKPDKVYTKGIESKMKGPGKPKMQFYSDAMAHTREKIHKVVKEHGIANIDLAAYDIAYSPVPTEVHAFPTPHREAENLPFYLITYKTMYRNQSACSNTNPILNFALGDDTDENYVLMNEDAANRLGVKTGDLVTVQTRVGKATGKCRTTQGIRPDTIGISYHYGHLIKAFPEYSRKGIDVNRILELHADKISGMNSFNDTKCNVFKA